MPTNEGNAHLLSLLALLGWRLDIVVLVAAVAVERFKSRIFVPRGTALLDLGGDGADARAKW